MILACLARMAFVVGAWSLMLIIATGIAMDFIHQFQP